MAIAYENKLDFLPQTAELSLMPSFDLRSLGAAFALGQDSQVSSSGASPLTAAKLSGRCGVRIRQGFDPIDESSTGRVVEGTSDIGITLRKNTFAFSLNAGNISIRAGLDDPLAAAQASIGASSVPSLKVTLAKEYEPDCYAAVSYDIRQRKPEVALAWAGQTFTEKAAVVLHADPLLSTYNISASVSFPGPDWRSTMLDEAQWVLERPEDDGARHRLWVAHTIKARQWGYRTRLGAAFDLGRLLNLATHFVNTKLETVIPRYVWRVPGATTLFNVLFPAEDEHQVHHHVHDWDLEVAHEFGHRAPTLGLAKHMRYATVRATYDVAQQELGLQYKRGGLSLTATLEHARGAGPGAWWKPALHLHLEPLGCL